MSETDGTATTDTASQEAGQDVATQDTQAVADAASGADAPEDGEAVQAEAEEEGSGKDGEDGDGKDGPPEAYEFTAPEGVELDADLVSEFEPVARELNLTQEQAQQVVDLFSGKVLPHILNQQVEEWAAKQAEWAESSKKDEEFGGDKLAENLGLAKTTLDKLGTPELKQVLEETKLGDHPEVIRLFVRIGKSISEDTFDGGSSEAGGDVSTAKKMFPNMN